MNTPIRIFVFNIIKWKKLLKMVKEGEMPLNSYTWMHKDAKLTEAEKNKLDRLG